jgi:hypothetical protein
MCLPVTEESRCGGFHQLYLHTNITAFLKLYWEWLEMGSGTIGDVSKLP